MTMKRRSVSGREHHSTTATRATCAGCCWAGRSTPHVIPLALYVGVKAYQEAGGLLIRDLFQEDQDAGYIGDAELLQKLASDKLAVEADKLQLEGWKWTEGRCSFDYSDRHHFGVARTTLRPPTAKERTKLAALEKEQQEAEAKLEEMYECEDDEAFDRKGADALESAAEEAGQGIENLQGPNEDVFGGSFCCSRRGGQHRPLGQPRDPPGPD